MGYYLLLPAKDEAQALSQLIPEAQAEGLAVVVCDDGSQDGTGEVARALGAQVLPHETNRGLAQALRTLLDYATDALEETDIAVLADADGTMSPKDARRLAEALDLLGADVVIGSRYEKGGGQEGVPLLRQVFSWGARVYLGLTLALPGVTDYTTGFRAYRVAFLKAYRDHFPYWFMGQGFTAQTELLFRAYHFLGAKVWEIGAPIHYSRKAGASKMRLWRTVKEYLRLGAWGLGMRLVRRAAERRAKAGARRKERRRG